jgi:hypothetical protein
VVRSEFAQREATKLERGVDTPRKIFVQNKIAIEKIKDSFQPLFSVLLLRTAICSYLADSPPSENPPNTALECQIH